MTTVISVENLSKQYRLGTIGTGTLSQDLNRWWARMRGKPDPTLKIGQSPVVSQQSTVNSREHPTSNPSTSLRAGFQLPTSNSIWALRDVSFEVKQGEVLGIIGRNGAGKSTLLKILSRVTAPTSGEVKVKGRIASLLEVGTGFHPELTGRENIFLNGAILGMSKREIARKFDEIVAFAEIEKFIDTPVKRYSSGMYVRLAFAVAAHLEPEILLVDEVLAVGDAAFQKKCLGKMGDVAKEGRTVLFVSHNMGAISNLCQTSICLESGRIADGGKTELVVAGYVMRSSTEVPGDGFADLHSRKRSPALNNRSGQFEWVRTVNGKGQQIGTFLERESIVIEVGFSLQKESSFLQLGCGITAPDIYGEIFTVPSPEYLGQFAIGNYSARIQIDPNYLRAGTYQVTLKMFINGLREDTIGETIQLTIVNKLSPDDLNAYSRKWVYGRFRFDYVWSEPVYVFKGREC